MKFSDLISQLSPQSHSFSSHPELNPDLYSITGIDQAQINTLSYVEGEKFGKMVTVTTASALILPLDTSLQAQATERGIAWLSSSYPRLTFAQAINLFYQPFQPESKIHPTAVIADDVKLGKNISIGAHVVIEKGVTIANDVCIFPNVVIYPHVTIGDRTIIHSNATIEERSQIGANCVIHSGAVIGGEGFGFVPIPEGWYKMQQSGYVVLEDGVEIGCNSTIDRPAVGITRIGKNTKLDNLVHVGHNGDIGENCALAAQVGLAGGVKLGNRVILAGQVGVANQVQIEDNAMASAQSGIHHDVKTGETVSGSPAVNNKLYLKVSAIYKKLPEIYKIVKDLQKNKP
ncbi:MAG: UDP-3-O-(3-hydroxymyristoyl)glucosamine N-acyltransferase [Cyanobacteria bacterium]|nr:UDP-3-O-(3-hydroxymyristoyl)glucosamine N-acyltransferase [Cyanobacteria bacterium CG_2015-16_32_12]NCO76762.1 UDP-3-O-(3-hydroxymyristoyl)glucosamine N-acyltransferase [Cyanobacteria bacterium CG_2015-22_32_23]NCQ03896.1 UDP-3-O-(3-hydroxymyristoyl)glucosamine N-acyltransferase [Cyanobacteria bacterium CG_2015-09_32_10]NCQ41704.1 UDP-3-O-(3-hydroxymyristoyl)glucosamine N-acyltransferase [Cyanobacteria bacterium CG_2015-04_32_10]NCS85276.1 UDP-3-O-(3-hydroxymyristoyl)glucosamine N-acyltransf